MRIDSRTGLRGKFQNAVTGAPIRFVIWADLDTGEFEAFRTTQDGTSKLRDWRGIAIRYRGRQPLRFLPDAPLIKVPTQRQPYMPDLEEERRRLGVAPVAPEEECEAPGCHRRYEYETGDEQIVQPATDEHGKPYEVGVTTKVHRFCSWHFRNPLSVSERGVESEIQTTVRPD